MGVNAKLDHDEIDYHTGEPEEDHDGMKTVFLKEGAASVRVACPEAWREGSLLIVVGAGVVARVVPPWKLKVLRCTRVDSDTSHSLNHGEVDQEFDIREFTS